MKSFADHIKSIDPKYPMSGKHGKVARQALDIEKFHRGRKGEQIPDADGDLTWGEFIAAYRIDEYVRKSGDGPESLKDLFRF